VEEADVGNPPNPQGDAGESKKKIECLKIKPVKECKKGAF